MGLRVLAPTDSLEATSAALRLGPGPDLRPLLAASLRRAASLMCPSTPSAITTAVWDVLHPVISLPIESLHETLDALVGVGDLVESVEQRFDRRQRVIHLGRPRFIRRRSGDLLLLGTRPDNLPLVSEALEDRVQTTGHLRRIIEPDAEVFSQLDAYGLREIPEARWTGRPEPTEARDFIDFYVRKLRRQPLSGTVEGLRVLDPASTPTFYRGRWRSASASDNGVFVARRSQRYGSDLWCLVELTDGEHHRLLDLPLPGATRGCDEAWQLQAAIDAANGNPQQLLIRRTGRGRVQLGLPSPPPKWLQRRWDLLGEPVRVPSALLGYEFEVQDARDEAEFVRDHLWMTRRIDERDKRE